MVSPAYEKKKKEILNVEQGTEPKIILGMQS
jgi:hypothetical protein